jgi:hypothetical protein
MNLIGRRFVKTQPALLNAEGTLPTLDGSVEFDLSIGVTFDAQAGTTVNVPAFNGVVHVVDRLLLPEEGTQARPTGSQSALFHLPCLSIGVTFDGQAATTANVPASSGVIHVVDRLLLPEEGTETLPTGNQPALFHLPLFLNNQVQ